MHAGHLAGGIGCFQLAWLMGRFLEPSEVRFLLGQRHGKTTRGTLNPLTASAHSDDSIGPWKVGLGEVDAGKQVEDAVAAVIAEGKNVTYDLKPTREDPSAVGTQEMAEAIVQAMA